MESVFAFIRSNEENTVFCVFNFSAEPVKFTVTIDAAGDYNCVCGEAKSLKAGQVVELKPWGFMLLSK